ncbi:basic amino acid/polyamine antiporter [Atopobiaceae bacterium 24-176]
MARGGIVPKRVGLVGLVGISVSAMVGGGIYSLPASVASHASAGATLLAWLVTGIGMWFVVSTFRTLAQARPDLTNGVYSYAERGFGRLVGFLVMLGYWCTSCCAMASYGVLIMATLSSVFPAFGAGNTVPALIGASCVVWGVFALARHGVEQASVVNIVGTVAKFVPVAVFVVVCLAHFDVSAFSGDFFGAAPAAPGGTADGLISQVGSVMMVTLWVFIGIEGAVVVSADATSQKAVGRAVTVALGLALVFYVLVSVVPFGIYPQHQIAAMASPSTAAILSSLVGGWGRGLVSVGIIVSILSSWLVWMCMQGQMPTSAASDGVFPARFAERNRFGAPGRSLLTSAAVTQLFLVFACVLGDKAWDTMVSITSVMTVPAYFCCCLFLVKEAVVGRDWQAPGVPRPRAFVVGAAGCLFGVVLLVAAGVENLMLASIVFALGLPLFLVGLRQSGRGAPLRTWERAAMAAIVVVAAASALGFVLQALA